MAPNRFSEHVESENHKKIGGKKFFKDFFSQTGLRKKNSEKKLIFGAALITLTTMEVGSGFSARKMWASRGP
jgi:hypothetical protein